MVDEYVELGACPSNDNSIGSFCCDPDEGLKVGDIVGCKRNALGLDQLPILTSYLNIELDHHFVGVVSSYIEGRSVMSVVYRGFVYAFIPITSQDMSKAKTGAYLNLVAPKQGVSSSNVYNLFVFSKHKYLKDDDTEGECFKVWIR